MEGEPSFDPTRSLQLSETTQSAVIGPYRLIRQLGEGGMGLVFLAQQTHPIRRDVALKVIKPGMDSKQVIARFESERQALAMMDHPNIARVFDAGTTPSGLPYFVMELVDGSPITRYCDSQRLTLRERIELFIPVCKAIQHAHQKGVIHRDIKPSNILVTRPQNDAVPKVIDFGLAKALGQRLSEATMMTNVGTVVGTLNYMSPEQAELGRQDIDTRSDVYSLGAVLYELLTGTTPLDRLEAAPFLEVLQRIREEETKAPSTRVRQSDELKDTAELRQSDPSKLPGLLDRELDWIAMKALEKDRSRRYETVNGLARDLQRYLQGEPVEAAPPSASYRLGKFLRKYRVWLATAAAFALVLIAGVVVSVWMAVRAGRAQAEAQAVNDFLQNDLLAQASAYNQTARAKPDPNLTVRVALDRAAERIEGKFAKQPLVEASIRHKIGTVYVDLSLYPEAERQFERALAIRRRELGERDVDTLRTMASLAAVYERRGKIKEAEPLYRGTVATMTRVLGEQHPDTLKAMNGLAVTYAEEGDYAKAEPIFERVVAGEQRVLGEQDLQTLRAMGNLAATYDVLHKYSLAEPLLVKTLELKRRSLGEENPETLDTMTNLATYYTERGDYAKAEPLEAAAVAAYRRILGDSHPHTINAMNVLALLYRNRGDYAQAEALCKQALEGARRGPGEEHPIALATVSELAQTYEKEGRLADAASLFEKALDARRRVLGAAHPDTLESLVLLGSVRIKQQNYVGAESTLREALAACEKSEPDAWQCGNVRARLGASLADQKRFADAEPLLLAGYQGMTQHQDTMDAPDRHNLVDAGQATLRMYRDWGKPEKAAEWQRRLPPQPAN